MKYFTTAEVATQWNLTSSRVLKLAKGGRIKGAVQIGKRWLIPDDAVKPPDGRTRAGKIEIQTVSAFRYPVFEFKDINSFNPPLSSEEFRIKRVIEAFNAFRFSDADAILGDLPEQANDRYIRITALYCGCMVSIALCNTGRFLEYYGRLKAELSENFPHRTEMSEYLHEINSVLGEDSYYSSEFFVSPAYCYHQSFLPRLCNLSALQISFGNKKIATDDLTAYEINCAFLEKTDNYFDLQAVHVYLACAYSVLGKKEECNYHFRRALALAEKYNMFYTIACMQYYYTQKSLEEALRSFSDDFKSEIKKHNDFFHKSHIRFANALQMNSLYKMLSGSDYLYIVLSVQGLSHKEIAGRMRVSVGTVGKRYSEIYAMLGVKDKAELIELYHRLTAKNVNN